MIAAVTTFSADVGVAPACSLLGVSRSTYYRSQRPQVVERERSRSPRALTQAERREVVDLMNGEEFSDATPRQIWATLLDRGSYVAHWRTMYRILAQSGQVRERRDQLRHPKYEKPELLAKAPNELWSWDISVPQQAA